MREAAGSRTHTESTGLTPGPAWLHCFEALTAGLRSDTMPGHTPTAAVDDLVRAASALLRDAPRSSWWPLAARIVASAPAAGPVPRPESPETAEAAFSGTLVAASESIYYCRKVEHASGRCLFSVDGSTHGLCAEILSAAHRAQGPGSPARSADADAVVGVGATR